MATKRIGVDIDGVLAIFDRAYSDVLIKESGRDLFPHRPYDPPCWDWTTELGYTKEEEDKAWEAVMSSHTFWTDLDAYAETAGVLKRLADAAVIGHEVYFITNRPGTYTKRQTEQFLLKHCDGISYHLPTVLVSGAKGLCAAGLKLHGYIDDKPENCVDVVNYMGLACQTYLMDRSWNQKFTDLRSIKRVSSVHQMLDEMEL